MNAGRPSFLSNRTPQSTKDTPDTWRSQKPYAGRVPRILGACSVLFSGGTMLASEVGCPPGTVNCTLVSFTFSTRLPAPPEMVLLNSGAPLTGETSPVPVTLVMVM